MIIRQAIFGTTIITQTESQVSLKLRDMEFIYVPTDKTRLDEIFRECVEIEEMFME